MDAGRLLVLFAALTTALFALPLIGSAADRQPSALQIDSECRQYFHDACSEALGRWLTGGDRSAFWRYKASTPVHKTDAFRYGTAHRSEPTDGTFVVFGQAGPEKGNAVYDRSNGIVFFNVGCCTWYDVVAAAGAEPPPKSLVARNLAALTTRRGIRLGQTVGDVRRIYGPSPLRSAANQKAFRILSYASTRKDNFSLTAASCLMTYDFYFKRGRLAMIDFGEGC